MVPQKLNETLPAKEAVVDVLALTQSNKSSKGGSLYSPENSSINQKMSKCRPQVQSILRLYCHAHCKAQRQKSVVNGFIKCYCFILPSDLSQITVKSLITDSNLLIAVMRVKLGRKAKSINQKRFATTLYRLSNLCALVSVRLGGNYLGESRNAADWKCP